MRWSLALVAYLAASTALTSTTLAEGWPVAHGDTANASHVARISAPAVQPLRIVAGLGSIADGSAPVVSTNGKVFLANQQGKVMGFHADGTKYWEIDLGSGWGVTAAPALSDFNVLFLLASRKYTDHTVSPARYRIETDIVSISEDGRLLFRNRLPRHGFGAAPTAPLNFVRGPEGRQALVFPARYSYPGNSEVVHLFVYDLINRSEPLADVIVSERHEVIDSGIDWEFGYGFDLKAGDDPLPPDRFQREFKTPAPGAAVPQGPGLDPGLVTINDTLGHLVRYRFSGAALTETDRWSDDGAISGPVVARNGTHVYARENDVTVLQLDDSKQRRPASSLIAATPVVRPNGIVIAASAMGIREAAGSLRANTGAEGRVPPTATQNHLYVSTQLGLVTYRLDDLAEVARYPWVNGGRQQPAIGPRGEIYAVADNKLHVFVAGVTGNEPGAVAGGIVGPLDNGVDAGAGGAARSEHVILPTKPFQKTLQGSAP